jgi:mono/diheme cytochrome c family protein
MKKLGFVDILLEALDQGSRGVRRPGAEIPHPRYSTQFPNGAGTRCGNRAARLRNDTFCGGRSRRDVNRARKILQGTVAAIAPLIVLALLIVSARSVARAQARSEGAAQSASAPAKTGAPAGDAKNGKAVYTADGCYECHGREAQGGQGTGPKLGPNPLPYQAFAYQVRVPRDQMPPYTSKVLSDAQLADIYAFVQSAPQPPKVESLTQLK